MTHWTYELLGIPWSPDGVTLETFSCWGLLRYVYKTQKGIELPEVQGFDFSSILDCRKAVESSIPSWVRTKTPKNLSAVALSRSTKFVHHVGIWLEADGGVILHCHEVSGVVIETPASMAAQGWKTIDFYDHRN